MPVPSVDRHHGIGNGTAGGGGGRAPAGAGAVPAHLDPVGIDQKPARDARCVRSSGGQPAPWHAARHWRALTPRPPMPIPLASVPTAASAIQRHLPGLPFRPLRLHHPIKERFTCAGCGILLIVRSPSVLRRPLAYTTLRCECGHNSFFPGHPEPVIGAA